MGLGGNAATREEAQGARMATDGLVTAFRLSRPPKPLAWQDVGLGQEPEWLHLDRGESRATSWLRDHSGLDAVVVDALLAEETRPRLATFGDGLMVILRGVNQNPGADPDDMVSLRIWIDARRIVTIRARRLMAAQDLKADIERGVAPSSTADVLIRLVAHLVARVAPVVDSLGDSVDELEQRSLDGPVRQMRSELASVRRAAIGLRRYLAPQRDVLARLAADPSRILDEGMRMRLRESVDAMMRYVEELDALRERCIVVAEEIATMLAERMNRTMYVLSLVGTVFLPLGFITGLLGVNVAGIPGEEYPLAFGLLTFGLVALGVLEVVMFRRWRLV
jgi:zinc transporter